jgi:hypothetical protein
VHRVPIRSCPCALSPPLGPPLALRHRLTGLPYPTSPTYPTDWRPPLAKREAIPLPTAPPSVLPTLTDWRGKGWGTGHLWLKGWG